MVDSSKEPRDSGQPPHSGSHPTQYESALTISPPAARMSAAKTTGLMVALRNLTEPSPKTALDPPGCKLYPPSRWYN